MVDRHETAGVRRRLVSSVRGALALGLVAGS
jgi:hypothetical protein